MLAALPYGGASNQQTYQQLLLKTFGEPRKRIYAIVAEG